jgi:hypothetical protein
MTNDDQWSSPIALNGLDDSRRALLDMLEGMRRTLCLYTPLVRAELYNDAEILAAIRSRLVSQPRLRLHWVLPPAREWRNTSPHLVRLGERLISSLILHTPIPEERPDWPELSQAFAIADERGLLHFSDPRRLIGSYDPHPGERMKQLQELFRELWSRTQPDPDLQRLGL